MHDLVAESVSFFLGNVSKDVNLSKLEAALSIDTAHIRELDHSGSSSTRKYLCTLIEHMVNVKKMSQRDTLLLLHATSSGIIKLADETMWHLEAAANVAVSGDSTLSSTGKIQMMQDRINTISQEYDTYKEEKFLEAYQQNKVNGELLMKVDDQASTLFALEDRIKQLEEELQAAVAATPLESQTAVAVR